MERVFEHFHLNLVENAQRDLLIEDLSREAWLRLRFLERLEFTHHAKPFFWVPHADQSASMILGTVERKKPRIQHKGPDEGATEFEGEEWQGSFVVIDPEHRPDGQKVAFERDRAIGQPGAVLDSLITSLNGAASVQYTIVVKSLFNAESFRSFAKRHGQLVKYVNFNFVVPNMFFGASTSIDQGLRRIGGSTGAQTVTLRLESESGVKADADDVEDALKYAEAGNASVTSKAMNGDLYSSTSRRTTVKMQSILDLIGGTKAAVKSWLNQALGREDGNSLGDLDRPGGDPPVG